MVIAECQRTGSHHDLRKSRFFFIGIQNLTKLNRANKIQLPEMQVKSVVYMSTVLGYTLNVAV